MSAEVLRRAASLMRERAEKSVCACGGPACIMENAGVRHDEMTARFDGWTRVVDHYVGMTPSVALAIAEWLEATAVRIDKGRDYRDGGSRNHGWRGTHEALAVARAYLGESA